MTNSTEYLLQLADTCDKLGYHDIADELDSLIVSKSFEKVSQYVGTVGFAIKQQRAISNCLRKKRAASNQPMQEIVFECLSEYQDGQSFYDEDWIGKYASQDNKAYINNLLLTSAKAGIDPSTATRKFIETFSAANDLQADINKLNSVWQRVKEASLDTREDFGDLGNIVKKAGFWDAVSGLGRGIAGLGEGAGLYMQDAAQWAGDIAGGWGYRKVAPLMQQLRSKVQQLNNIKTQTLANLQNIINYPVFQQKHSQLYGQFVQAIKNNDFGVIYQSINELLQRLNRGLSQPATPSGSPVSQAESSSLTWIYKYAAPPLTGPGNPAWNARQINLQRAKNKERAKTLEEFQQREKRPPDETTTGFLEGVATEMQGAAQPTQQPATATQPQQKFYNFVKTVQNELARTVPATTKEITDLLGQISEAARTGKYAGPELSTLSTAMANLSKNPFDEITYTDVMNALNTLDQKLRNPQKQQQPQRAAPSAGAKPPTSPEPAAGGGGDIGAGGQASTTELVNAYRTIANAITDPKLLESIRNALGLERGGTPPATSALPPRTPARTT